jgi:hypothetical protein
MSEITEIDQSVRKEVFRGFIPVVVTLAKSETPGFVLVYFHHFFSLTLQLLIYCVFITEKKSPLPYYCLLPRCSYLPLVIDDIKAHFQSTVPSTSDIWFEVNGEPLRWHLFIGILFDLHGNQFTLPWPIVVHFQNFPTNILRCESNEAIKNFYFQSLKEGLVIKHKALYGFFLCFSHFFLCFCLTLYDYYLTEFQFLQFLQMSLTFSFDNNSLQQPHCA